MISALKEAKGIDSHGVKIAIISRDTHYRWLREDEEYMKLVDQVADEALDFVESKLLESMTKKHILPVGMSQDMCK